jgi:quercetin dioxygenase-like cupin family protein
LETAGRLRYIDGCSDTLLISPPRLGDPCLNHLHIPPHTDQTPHTHPSARIGIILQGVGECRTLDRIYPLQPGMGWYIPTGCLHSFFTRDEALDVVAWHPDSDFGPRDDDHPMINRTVIAPH